MNTAKGRQAAKNARSGKYRKAFIRCVIKTGRWRGRPAKVSDEGRTDFAGFAG